MRVLLPEPETPVIHTSLPKGIRTSMSLRLFCRAPLITSSLPEPGRLLSGSGICFRPLKYSPVLDWRQAITSSIVPDTTTSPPCSPAPGPISMI